MFGTLAGIALLAVTAVAAASTLRIRGRATFFVASLVMAAASIVLIVEVLSLFQALTRTWIFVAQFLLAGFAAAVWSVTGRPRPPAIGALDARAVVTAARAHPAVAVLSFAVLGAFILEFVLAVSVAPNNWDSMTYHMSRVGHWLQHQSAMQWPDGMLRQLYSAPNAEMLIAWTVLVHGTDHLAPLVQWTSLAGCVVAIFSLARWVGYTRAPSLFAAGLFAAMPQPALQSTSTQNDLVTSFFIVSAILFAVRSFRDRSRGDLAIAATSLGLAVGTKGTTLIAGPALVLVAAYSWWRYRPPTRFLAVACAFACSGVLAFGAFNYVQTLRNTGTLVAPLQEKVERTSPVHHNLGRIFWTFADAPGTSVPWLNLMIKRPFQHFFGGLRRPGFELGMNVYVHEDLSAFGLVGCFVFLPIILIAATRPRSPPACRILALAAAAYMVTFAIMSEWNPWLGRVLVPGVAIGAPLLASVGARPRLSGFALALAMASFLPALLINPNKPLLVERRQKNVFDFDRLEQQTINRTELRPVFVEINARVHSNGTLGLVGHDESWDYPLFGERFERRIVQLHSAIEVTAAYMFVRGLDGVIFEDVKPPSWLVAHKLGDHHYLALTKDQGDPPDASAARP